MVCPCKKEHNKQYKCFYAQPTNVRWAISEACKVTHCYNPKMLIDPPEWKQHIRLATVGDTINGKVIDTQYINVRSCFCYCDTCPHFNNPNKEEQMDIDKLFTNAYVISLDRRKERLQRFRESLGAYPKLNEKVKTYNAIDGSLCPPPYFWMSNADDKQRNGSWGCFCSHIRLIEQAINEHKDGLLLFEDDCIFADDFQNKLETALTHLPPVYDILYLGGQHVEVGRGIPKILNEWWVKGYNINRTHAYYIPKHYLKTVYQHLYSFGANSTIKSNHIDWQLGELCKKRNNHFLCLKTPLCYQGGGESDIGSDLKLNTFEFNHIGYPEQLGRNGMDVRLCYHNVGYGLLAVNKTGYDVPLLVNAPINALCISAHAPSSIIIFTSIKYVLQCVQNGDNNSITPSKCYVDREFIGQIKNKYETTPEIEMEAGVHFLDIENENNGNAHTIWVIKEKE